MLATELCVSVMAGPCLMISLSMPSLCALPLPHQRRATSTDPTTRGSNSNSNSQQQSFFARVRELQANGTGKVSQAGPLTAPCCSADTAIISPE